MLVKNKDKRSSSKEIKFEIESLNRLNKEEIISDKVKIKILFIVC